MINNLIFLNKEDFTKPIYRIFPLKRLMTTFEEKKLTLVRPRLWDDPFENFILRARGKQKDGTIYDIAYRDYYYGQCWSFTKESDAMWRIYSPKKDGIKVKTTIAKLFNPIYLAGGEYEKLNGEKYNLSSFIGKVKYSSTPTLLKMLQNKGKMDSTVLDQSGWGQASTFYFKRLAFKHENEVRLIFSDRNTLEDIIKIDIEPNNLFDEIVLDPRMAETKVISIKKKILKLGFSKSIIQSGLYKIPKLNIELTI